MLLDSQGKQHTVAQIHGESIACVNNDEQKQKERAKGLGRVEGKKSKGS